jgi:hypothetical protein
MLDYWADKKHFIVVHDITFVLSEDTSVISFSQELLMEQEKYNMNKNKTTLFNFILITNVELHNVHTLCIK